MQPAPSLTTTPNRSAMPTPGRVLVTGGAGFIGSELTRQLLATGAEVLVVDNLVNGKRENLAGLESYPLTLHVADIRDRATMQTLMRDVERLYHLACLGVRHSIHSPWENHEVNAGATLTLLELAMTAGVERFVMVSTSEVYGTARHVPMTEEHPTFPMTVYGSAKLAGECYARACHATCGFKTVVVRPFNAYGPRSHHEGDSGEVIPKFMLRAMADQPLIIFGDGTQTRDFTYVADTARGILLAGLCDAAIGQTLNLGSSREYAIADLARVIMQVTGRPAATILHDAPRPGDVLRLYADASRAKELLDFQPTIPLTEGLMRLHDWFLHCGTPPGHLLEQEVVHNWRRRQEHP